MKLTLDNSTSCAFLSCAGVVPRSSATIEFLEFYAHRKLHLDNSCLSYVSDGFNMFLQTGTKLSTNTIPKRSKALTFENCPNDVAF